MELHSRIHGALLSYIEKKPKELVKKSYYKARKTIIRTLKKQDNDVI